MNTPTIIESTQLPIASSPTIIEHIVKDHPLETLVTISLFIAVALRKLMKKNNK